MHPGVEVHSLWELIDSDPAFSFADHHELKAYIQDCWRSRDRKDEQDAVRSLMKKMNIDIMELSGSREKTDFCGVSLYRAQPPRNPKLAPKHYVAGAAGKFIPHSPEEQEEIMPDLMKLENMTEFSNSSDRRRSRILFCTHRTAGSYAVPVSWEVSGFWKTSIRSWSFRIMFI